MAQGVIEHRRLDACYDDRRVGLRARGEASHGGPVGLDDELLEVPLDVAGATLDVGVRRQLVVEGVGGAFDGGVVVGGGDEDFDVYAAAGGLAGGF